MDNNNIDAQLEKLNLDQLKSLLNKLNHKVTEKKQAIKAASKVPPRSQSDIEKLADLQGLDLSGLMREISKR